MNQMTERNIKFHHVKSSTFSSTKKYLNYMSRLKKTISLYKKQQHPILIQYGSFLDVLSALILSKFCCKPYIICHIGSAWLHIRVYPLRKLTEHILKKYCNNVFYIADLQKKIINLPQKSIKAPTIINKNFALDGEKTNRRDFLYLGRISETKGIFDLIKAYKKIPRHLKEKNSLHIYGPGEKSIIRNMMQEIENDPFIEYKGIILDEELKKNIYYQYRILVSASIYDAFPLNVLEAAASGVIPIVSNVSEAANFVNHSNLICAPNRPEELKEKMIWALESTDQLRPHVEEMKKESRKYATGKLVLFLKSEILNCEIK